MRGKQVLLILAVALVSLVLMAGGGRPARANPGGVQDFDLDAVDCLIGSYPPAIPPSPDPMAGPYQVCQWGWEDKALGPRPTWTPGYALSTAIGLIGGNRTGLPYVYNGPGWGLLSDAQIPNGTAVADIVAIWDLFANGVPDVTADPSNCGGPPNNCNPATPLNFTNSTGLPYLEQTTAWGPGTGCSGTDESSLTLAMPGASAMTRYVRYRACIGTMFLNGYLRFTLSTPTPLNLVFLHPNWSPAGTEVNLATLATSVDAPTTALTTLDSPQASLTSVRAPYADNPLAPGLYVRWTTEISNPDARNGTLNFVYSTSCKAIGGNYTDADSDCAATVANPGGPADTNDANPDQDGDGLLDGIEAAWGSNPLAADTDGDGRSDLEEMVGPSQYLTDPTKVDTDNDGVNDGGLRVDGPDPGLAPDFPDENGDGVVDSGLSANLDLTSPADGSSHRRVGYKIVGRDIQPNGAGRDNCGSIPNASQLNSDLDAATTLGNGDYYGDACDTDWDNDSMTNTAETNFKWQPIDGTHPVAGCSSVPPMAPPADTLNPLDPDTDNDGIPDGIECNMGSNPRNATDVPVPCGARPDADSDLLCWTSYPTLPFDNEEVHWRTDGISGQPPFNGDTKADSDWDTLTDGCEVLIAGTQPMNPDSDGDTVTDNNEAVGGIALAPGHNACSAPTTEYTAIGNGRSVNAPYADDTTVPNSKGGWTAIGAGQPGGRTADTDKDGLLNYLDPDPAGGLPTNMDITYDDNANGVPCFPPYIDWWDDGPSWDANCNSRLDGKEAICPLAVNPNGDDDGDGLKNTWEVCKWGTDPNIVDSDSDGIGDCQEAADVDGSGTVAFGGDVLAYAEAALLPAGLGPPAQPGTFGKDGDFDINGDGIVDFVSDAIPVAKIAFGINPCK